MTDRTVDYEFGEFRLDPVARMFTRQHQPIALAPKSFDLLMLLVERTRAGPGARRANQRTLAGHYCRGGQRHVPGLDTAQGAR